MKKIVCVLLLVCMMIPCASADIASDLYWEYLPFADTYGAPTYKETDISLQSKEKNTYTADAGSVTIVYEITATNDIRTVIVCAKDDSCAADFLCTCTAMISYLGKTDFTAFGLMLGSFAMVRSGSESAPCPLGSDAFTIMSSDSFKYLFMYANNDLTTN